MQQQSMAGAIPAQRSNVEASKAHLPLAFVGAGHSAVVAKVRGNSELHHHLENLGFIEGASVRVIADNGGNLIVELHGSQVAIDKSVALKIITA